MNNWFKRSSVRLAFILAVSVTALLLLLNIIVSRRGEDIFIGAIHSIPFQLGDSFNGQIEIEAPRQFFTDQFRDALIWVTFIGIGLSAILGAVIGSTFIAQPLRRLQAAIQRLKERKTTEELAPTGLPEFDAVLHSFNDLSKELIRVEELRRDLISDTSHELKTPITSLLVQLEGMRDGVVPFNTERAEHLLKQVHRLDDLTERLQDYTRLRNRTVQIRRTSIKLRSLFESLVNELQEELSKKKVSVVINIPENLTLEADHHLLEQLFLNLFRNTLAYAEASKIEISAPGNTLIYQDNGKGVPTEALANLFERFYRVDQSRNRKHGGLGLGLAIAHEIVDAHGWQITASKPLKGHGLIFTISLS